MAPRWRTAGLSLVEAAAVVSAVGVLLAILVPTFVRELRTSKVEEASSQLEELHARAAAYFQARHEGGRRCLPAPAGPAPAEASVEPVEVDFADESTPGHATWEALGFAPSRPIRYRYELIPFREGCEIAISPGDPLFVLRATGDLDGDGRRSVFERVATVSDDGAVIPHGALYVRDRME
ncbi:MAG: hypothetical protein KF901_24005 [Myxococcales bacterium]|nr:hypothetical protein [Myxococcales bacterium]